PAAHAGDRGPSSGGRAGDRRVGRQRRADHAAHPRRVRQRRPHHQRRPAPARPLPRTHARRETLMAPPRAAARVAVSDLGSYQDAVRLVLTHDVITATRPRPGVLPAVLRWADQLTKDFRELLGYTLIATTRQVRLIRRLDELDATQGTMFAKNGKPFDR